MKWAGCILDVRTAFLNAQMEQEPDEDLLLVQPPHILKEMKFLDPDTSVPATEGSVRLQALTKALGSSSRQNDQDL